MNKYYDFTENKEEDETVIDAKDVVDKTCSIFTEVCEKVNLGGILKEPEIDFESLFKNDILNFMSYMAASDGLISTSDAEYISEVLDIDINTNKLNKRILDKNIYSEEFENEIPPTIAIIVALDNAIDSDEAPLSAISEGYIYLLILLARQMIERNGRTPFDEATDVEKDNLQIYCNMIFSFLNKKMNRYNKDIVFDCNNKK